MSDELDSPHPPGGGATSSLTIAGAIDRYLRYLAGKRRPSTVRTYEKSYRRFAEYLPDSPHLVDPQASLSRLTVEHLSECPRWLHDRGLEQTYDHHQMQNHLQQDVEPNEFRRR